MCLQYPRLDLFTCSLCLRVRMASDEEKQLYQLSTGYDVEAVSIALMTNFCNSTLTYALKIATQKLSQNDHMEERFQICSKLMAVGARMYFNKKNLPFHLIRHCCKHDNIAVLKQALAVLDSWHPVSYTRHKHVHADEYTTLCIEALQNKHYECAKIIITCCTNDTDMLMYKADTEEQWEFMITHLPANEVVKYAASGPNLECLKFVLQDRFIHDIDLNNLHVDDKSKLLFSLIRYNQLELLKQILKYDVDINIVCKRLRLMALCNRNNRYRETYHYETPLSAAVNEYRYCNEIKQWTIIRTLISHGCNADGYECEWSLSNPLPLSKTKLEILEMLLFAGANIVQPPENWIGTGKHMKRQIANIFEYYDTVVHPLKHLARLSIRRALTTSKFGTVPKLRGVLPPALINYLMLPEIDDIEAKYKVN